MRTLAAVNVLRTCTKLSDNNSAKCRIQLDKQWLSSPGDLIKICSNDLFKLPTDNYISRLGTDNDLHNDVQSGVTVSLESGKREASTTTVQQRAGATSGGCRCDKQPQSQLW